MRCLPAVSQPAPAPLTSITTPQDSLLSAAEEKEAWVRGHAYSAVGVQGIVKHCVWGGGSGVWCGGGGRAQWATGA